MKNNFLQKLENTLKKYNPYVLESLSIGLDVKTVELALATVGIKNRYLTDIYCWRNGIQSENIYLSRYDLCSFGKLMPLLTNITSYRDSVANRIWSSDFFPIVEEGGGGFLLLNHNADHKNFGTIHIYSPSLMIVEYPEIIYDSLETFVETIIRCYEDHAYTTHDNGLTLQIDYQKEQEISGHLNPKSTFWNSEPDKGV